ncbi:MAG: glycosyltransferase family 2 protein [Actinomycetota bacterium]|nr:glycosyltransferase family 2 protein [Actinomycetota bacterium]MEC7117056.1 glycosyltransferase family 2 protein [Actinomycetota bacterium]MEC7531826.1 glycosyltransferase family 2 protein [Actinomycetota bacterium]MEC8118654.1 glycosyltransferase family 2 protein [Actinomycetota bacterium]MEC8334504.1 glycosyltransferase family 2 protein [Actinomycetota bacterium]
MTKLLKDVAVVIPVFNEEKLIGECINEWLNVLDSVNLNYEILIIDDGSSDATISIVERYRDNQNIQLIIKQNEGHGPTILAGYKRAVGIAEWVFQADSDNEINPNQFSALWSRRQGQDAVIAWRQGRDQTTVRRLVTFFARVTTKVLFRCHLRDVNIPFRLFRSETLTILLEKIPSDTFAPNIALSGALSLMNFQVEECPVVFNERIVGESSLSNLGAVRKGGRALLELIKISRVFP